MYYEYVYICKCTSRQVLNIIIYAYGHTLRAKKFNRIKWNAWYRVFAALNT